MITLVAGKSRLCLTEAERSLWTIAVGCQGPSVRDMVSSEPEEFPKARRRERYEGEGQRTSLVRSKKAMR